MNKKHDHSKVLKSGLKLICTKGYNSLGVDEICKSTGMTKGAFYNAFKSKENFLLNGLKVYGEMTVKRLKSQLSKENAKPLAIDRLKDLYDSMFEAQPKNNFMGCMVNNIMSELGSNNHTVGSAASIEFNSFIEAIEPCVKEAQIDGDLTLSIDSKTLTELLHSTFYGSLTRTKSVQDHKQGKLMMQTLISSLENK
ncbi:MAG: TetR/AcrR family transcriptional regulator [Maribacter sp.]|nr:TetR/AcrR family transcriptional regulator [Maribacter sp.]